MLDKFKAIRVLLGLLFFSACRSVTVPSHEISAIDAQYKNQVRDQIRTFSDSPGVQFYRKVLSATLASHCSYFPSDSAYALSASRRCGPTAAMLFSYARFSREFNVAEIGLNHFQSSNHIQFEETTNACF